VPRVVWIALAIMIMAALLLSMNSLRIGLLSYFGCDVGEGNLSDCAVESDIALLLVGLALLWLLGLITLPLSYFALLGLFGFWLVTHRPSHSWWPVMLLAEAALVGLGIWVIYFL
jgi:hypothetical protein